MTKNYELKVQDDIYSVFVDEEEYYLSQENRFDLPLVQAQKQALLVKINLKEMLKNLLNCTNLLDIVYCSVAGIRGLPGRVSKLQELLLETLSDSELTMQGFVSATKRSLEDLSEVYPCLGEGDYEEAVSLLTSIKSTAQRMEKEAIMIRDAFQKCCDETSSILQDVYTSNQELLEHRDQASKELAEMNGELEALEVLKAILSTRIEEMNEEYKALEKKEEKASDRAFGLELTGAILGGLGELVSTILPIKELVSSDTSSQSQPESSTKENVSEEDLSKNEEIQNFNRKKEDLHDRAKSLDKEIETLKKELEDPNVENMTQKRELLSTKEKERAQIDQDIQTQEKTIEKVSSALKSTGSSFTKAASHEQNTVEAYNKRLEEVYRLRHEIEKQDAENKAKIAKYKAKIASTTDNRKSLDLTIQSLTMAIGSMRRIIVILNETVLFWKSIVVCCQTLSDSQLSEKIDQAKQSLSPTSKDPFYAKRSFITSFLLYLMKWQALQLVCQEYLDNLDTVRNNLSKSMSEQEGGREVQWKKAAEKAQALQL